MRLKLSIRKSIRTALCFTLPVFFAVAQSCSTTRVLSDGEYRLASNDIEVLNDKKFNVNQLEPYLKQKPNSNLIFGWNPFLNVYNWGGNKNTFFPKLFRKLGKAPVVYDADKVEASVENISRHLEYLGYYGSKVDADVNVKRKLVKVKYNVTLGKQFPIKEIHYTLPNNDDFTEAFYSDTSAILVKAGMPLSESVLEDESQRSSSFLRNAGYY